MRLWIWREPVSRGRRDWGLEQAQLLLAAKLSMEHGVWGPLGLAPAARGHRSQPGGRVHAAQALMRMQGPAPPHQFGLQGLDLLPQHVVVFLQGLVLLGTEADGWGRDVSQHESCTPPPGSLT